MASVHHRRGCRIHHGQGFSVGVFRLGQNGVSHLADGFADLADVESTLLSLQEQHEAFRVNEFSIPTSHQALTRPVPD
jgi:hypothetical protein